MSQPGDTVVKPVQQVREKLYEFIRSYWDDMGFAPSVKEMQAVLGDPSSARVRRLLREGAEQGRLTFLPARPRTVRMTHACSCDRPQVMEVYSLLNGHVRLWCIACGRDARW